MTVEITDSEYFARDEVSKSDLDLIHRSPAHYKFRKEHPEPPTPAMNFGSAYHCFMLEYNRFLREYKIGKMPDRRTKKGKAEYEAIVASGIQFISEKDYETLSIMRDKLYKHRAAKKLLEMDDDVFIEKPIFSEIEGVKTRIKPDVARRTGQLIIDLKTTIDARESKVMKSIGEFRYHVQHAFYIDNARHLGYENFVFIFQEKKAPFEIAVYTLEDDDIKQGRMEYVEDIIIYKECKKRDHWPGYGNFIMPINLPAWARRVRR